MAKIFRIKNKVLRFLAGLVAAVVNGIFYVVKFVFFMSLGFGGITGVGFAVRFMSLKTGFPGMETLAQWSKALDSDPALLNQMFLIGLSSILAIFLSIIAVLVVVFIPIEVYKKAKEAGDKYFNHVGDK